MQHARFNFEDQTLYADHDGALTQADVRSIWHHLPTTGALWIEKGLLYVEQRDGATVYCLGAVAPGVHQRVSAHLEDQP